MGHMTGRRRATGYGAITLYGREFNPVRLTRRFITPAGRVGARTHDPTTPHAQPPTGTTRARFGLIRFRSPLLTEYPFLQVLRCFTSLRTPRPTTGRYRPMTAGGFPHSEILGSKPCWRLPEAYRSLTRPSSVLSAKASTIRPSRTTPPTGTAARETSQQTPDNRSSHKTRSQNDPTKEPRTGRGPSEKTVKARHRTPTGPRSLLASTIQFSNHHAPGPEPPRPHGHGTPPRDTRNNHHPHPEQRGKRGPGSRSGNPKACRTTTREPPISSTPARPRPPDHPATQAKGPRKAPIRNSVERR